MPPPRIELGTSRSSVWRSPNWAIAAHFKTFTYSPSTLIICIIFELSEQTLHLKNRSFFYCLKFKRNHILQSSIIYSQKSPIYRIRSPILIPLFLGFRFSFRFGYSPLKIRIRIRIQIRSFWNEKFGFQACKTDLFWQRNFKFSKFASGKSQNLPPAIFSMLRFLFGFAPEFF